MKGISDIIAVLLMLIITIGLASLAYSYISGVFTSRTAVALTLDSGSSSCNEKNFTFYVRNEGAADSGLVTIKVTMLNGTNALEPNSQCNITNIPSMSESSTDCKRLAGTTAGNYRVTISARGASFTTIFYCPYDSR